MATDLFVLVICAGLSGKNGCTVNSEAGYPSQLACDNALHEMVVFNPPRPSEYVSGNASDNHWTTFAYCRPGTPAEVRRWDKDGLGPEAGLARARRR